VDLPEREPIAPSDTDPGVLVAHATGVLVLALQVTPAMAERSLTEAALRYGLSIGRLAAGVVLAASGEQADDPVAQEVVWREWGDLLH
jgi:hypothetical protein